MEIKEKRFKIYSRNEIKGRPIDFILHWDRDVKQYVLCKKTLFGYIHFTIEEVKDMLNILKRENR